MSKFDQDTAIKAVALHQLIAEWGYELDFNGGLTMPRLCTEDCRYLVGGTPYLGHAAILKFYSDRGERVRTQQKDGVRTQRHTISGLRVSFPAADSAQVIFLLVNYSAEGKAPALNLVGPTIIADCQMECRLEADGEWRIALFDSTPVFIGNDPFLNASVAPGQTR
ncbi:nuclear transport factor 2 family protein [Phenylobacterium sp. LjRoot225]|uniref:nuclear transport factor 2 family protein n=1 Tax=Phenylobacterium sp. LjRoot225 TaxID=3342285 RepID=UPI003ED0330A